MDGLQIKKVVDDMGMGRLTFKGLVRLVALVVLVALVSPPVLAMFDKDAEIALHTDATRMKGLGYALFTMPLRVQFSQYAI